MPEPSPINPETQLQIKQLSRSDRPLIICDVDEVVLHMIKHLKEYLIRNELVFMGTVYQLKGNIAKTGETKPISQTSLKKHLNLFFEEFVSCQTMVKGADKTLKTLAKFCDIIFLSNIASRHKNARENLLQSYNLDFPLVTNTGPKGGAAAALAAGRPPPTIFIDDSPLNHTSVKATFSAATHIQFIADKAFLNSISKGSHVDLLTGDWKQTEYFIRDRLNTKGLN